MPNTMKISVNTAGVNYFSDVAVFINRIHASASPLAGGLITAGTRRDTNTNPTSFNLDSDGYLIDFHAQGPDSGDTFSEIDFPVWAGIAGAPYFYTPVYDIGAFVFLWDGAGSFKLPADVAGTGDLTDTFSSTGGTNNRRVMTSTVASAGISIQIQSTGNPPNSGTDYARNFRMVYSPGSTQGGTIGTNEALLNSGSYWNPDYLTRLSPFNSALRFLNGDGAHKDGATWANRSLTSNIYWGIWPYETMVDLCNRRGQDLWINVPATADIDLVIQLLTFVHNNLNPSLKCYIEFYNEIWQFNFQTQATYLGNQGRTHFPNKFNVTATANGTSNRVRCTMQHSIGVSFVTGDTATITGVHDVTNGDYTINVINSTTVDIVGTTWTANVAGGTVQVSEGINYGGFTRGFNECLLQTANIFKLARNIWGADIARLKTVINMQNGNSGPMIVARDIVATDWGGLNATFTGTIDNGAGGAGTMLTVSGVTETIAIGQEITTGASQYTTIIAGSGTTWTVNTSQHVVAASMTAKWWAGQLKDYFDVVSVAPYFGDSNNYIMPAAWSSDGDQGKAKISQACLTNGLLPASSVACNTTTGTLTNAHDPVGNPVIVNSSSYAVGSTSITLAAGGVGNITGGEAAQVTIGQDPNFYTVTTGVADVSVGGTMVLAAPGLIRPINSAVGAKVNSSHYAPGATSITLQAAGTGAILSGSTVRIAGDGNDYIIGTGVADVSVGGTFTISVGSLGVDIPVNSQPAVNAFASPSVKTWGNTFVVTSPTGWGNGALPAEPANQTVIVCNTNWRNGTKATLKVDGGTAWPILDMTGNLTPELFGASTQRNIFVFTSATNSPATVKKGWRWFFNAPAVSSTGMVPDTIAGTTIIKNIADAISKVTNCYEGGQTMLGFGNSTFALNHAPGARVDASAYSIGATSITLQAVGSGWIMAGDQISFTNDPNTYTIATGLTDVSAGGTIVLTSGLIVAIASNAKPNANVHAYQEYDNMYSNWNVDTTRGTNSIYNVFTQYYTQLQAAGIQDFVHYTDFGMGPGFYWGLLSNGLQLHLGKYDATVDFLSDVIPPPPPASNQTLLGQAIF